MGLCIGQIDYANCYPIFFVLRKYYTCGAYRFVRGTPAFLNRMLLSGDIDLCPSSSIAYARSSEVYRLIPGLSISSIGPVKSVKLFSRLPLEKLDCMPIGLSVESETSVALLKIIFKKYYKFSNEFYPVVIDASFDMKASCPAVLVIGDTALKWSRKFPHLYQYDLGELWLSLTGFPFVFALWMIREDVVTDKPDESARLRDILLGAKKIATECLDETASECVEYGWMGRDGLLDYWKTISYDLTPRHLEGVNFFFQSAEEVGLLDRMPAIRFFTGTKKGERDLFPQ